MKNGGCDSSQFSSVDSVCNVTPIPFGSYIHAYKIQGASTEKDWQKGKRGNEYFFMREHTNKS